MTSAWGKQGRPGGTGCGGVNIQIQGGRNREGEEN